jgi:hypothetical protein
MQFGSAFAGEHLDVGTDPPSYITCATHGICQSNASKLTRSQAELPVCTQLCVSGEMEGANPRASACNATSTQYISRVNDGYSSNAASSFLQPCLRKVAMVAIVVVSGQQAQMHEQRR